MFHVEIWVLSNSQKELGMLKMYPPNPGFTHFSTRCICDDFKKFLFVCTVLGTSTAVRSPTQRREHPWLTWRGCCKSEDYLCINTWTIAPELHAWLHSGSASWLFHRSCKDNAFLNIIIEMPFFFTHLEIQTMPYCWTFLVQKDALFSSSLCISWLIDSYLPIQEKTIWSQSPKTCRVGYRI